MITNDPFEIGLNSIDELINEFNTQSNFNESDTRFHLIDKIICDCLQWNKKDIITETPSDNKYTDYILSAFSPIAIWEAKKMGSYFILPEGYDKKLILPIKTLIKENVTIKNALIQVSGYCQSRGVKIGVVCNGWQIIAFIANRNDSIPPMEGKALVISSLTIFKENFKEVWNCLSKVGLQNDYLEKKLLSSDIIKLPPKLSSQIVNYPIVKSRNSIQADLAIVSDWLLVDTSNEDSNKKAFLEKCYCDSGALSRYSELTKEIILTRYNYLFSQNDNKAILEPVYSKKGVSNELRNVFTSGVTKRPILLIGDVGVGKSTFIDNLQLVTAVDIFKEAITFKIDLGLRAILPDNMNKEVLSIIRSQLESNYNIDIEEANFVKHAYYLEFEKFKKSIQMKPIIDMMVTMPEMKIEYYKKEAEFYEKKINNSEQHLKQSLQHICNSRKKQLVIFIDNCDQRNDDDQQKAFLISQELAAEWNMLVFICLRPETYHRTKKKEGALSGYHSKAFTISPPRIDDVIIKRLEYIKGISQKKSTFDIEKNNNDFYSIYLLIDCFINSLSQAPSLYKFFDNICNGNIRKAIEFIKDFFGSVHIPTQKILDQLKDGHEYIIKDYHILKSVMYGVHQYYNPYRSDIINIFDIRVNNSKEYFIVLFILSILNTNIKNNRNDGFVLVKDIFNELQSCGYNHSSIELALSFMHSKELFDLSEKGNNFLIEKEDIKIRGTAIGLYYLNHLCSDFTYISGILVDVPIIDANILSKMKINSNDNKENIINRTSVFIEYLNQCWHENFTDNTVLDWNSMYLNMTNNLQQVGNNNKSFSIES